MERLRMKDLREDVGTKACIIGKIVKEYIVQRSKNVPENEEDHS